MKSKPGLPRTPYPKYVPRAGDAWLHVAEDIQKHASTSIIDVYRASGIPPGHHMDRVAWARKQAGVG
ncbi:MAG: hypothetical protein KGY41_01310 [Desulfovermiculus sp.]|nr:hypothetical protein [Desulfovermiculus sp.]